MIIKKCFSWISCNGTYNYWEENLSSRIHCADIPVFENIIVIRNGRIVWKHGLFCWYFGLSLKYLEWPYREYIKTAKNGDFCEELLSENDFEAVLTTFYCYDHGAKASEAVQKIATDQKEYCKCFLGVIPINPYPSWKMVSYKDISGVAKKAAEVAQKKER